MVARLDIQLVAFIPLVNTGVFLVVEGYVNPSQAPVEDLRRVQPAFLCSAHIFLLSVERCLQVQDAGSAHPCVAQAVRRRPPPKPCLRTYMQIQLQAGDKKASAPPSMARRLRG